eukprot:10632482-Lingulodinium_polyedra.AAC.1
MPASRPGVGRMLAVVQPVDADWAVLHFTGLHLGVGYLWRSLLQGRHTCKECLDAVRLPRCLKDALLCASVEPHVWSGLRRVRLASLPRS